MLIRIARPCRGTVDGVTLDDFEVGHTYDVSTALATYLVVEQLAEPATVQTATASVEKREFSGNWRDWAVAADMKKI